jgi:hypothetical protein
MTWQFGSPEIHVLDISGCSSLQEMIEELGQRDNYKLLYKIENYKEPSPIFQLQRLSSQIGLHIDRTYRLELSYQEVAKIGESFPRLTSRETLTKILRLHPDYEKIVINAGFPLDSMHSFDVELTGMRVIFTFSYKEEFDIQTLAEESLIKRFENQGSCRHAEIIDEIKKKVGEII